MASLKKLAVAVTVAVWTSALGSAVALGFVLNHPPPPRMAAVPSMAHASVAHLLGADPGQIVEISPPVTFTPARPPVASKPSAPVSVDIENMKCDDWRDLQAGSGQVQVCGPVQQRSQL